MDVVLGRIAVGDVQFLIDHYGRNVRLVVTTILIQSQSVCGSLKAPVTNLRAIGKRSLFDIDENIGELTIFNNGVFGSQIGILLSTRGISVSSNLLRRRRRSGEGNSAGDSSFISLCHPLFHAWSFVGWAVRSWTASRGQRQQRESNRQN